MSPLLVRFLFLEFRILGHFGTYTFFCSLIFLILYFGIYSLGSYLLGFMFRAFYSRIYGINLGPYILDHVWVLYFRLCFGLYIFVTELWTFKFSDLLKWGYDFWGRKFGPYMFATQFWDLYFGNYIFTCMVGTHHLGSSFWCLIFRALYYKLYLYIFVT